MRAFAIILLVILAGTSCTKLEEDIYDKIPEDRFPENEQQAALSAVPTYKELSDLVDDAGWWFWAQEVSSDEIVFPTRDVDWDDGGKWRVLHTHTWDNNTDAINSMWSHMYEGVAEANRALDELGPSAPASKIAELTTLRAFFYYLLIDNYGDVPYTTSFFDAPAQPFKEDRAVIYQNLVTDIEASIPALKPFGNNFAVTRGMAYALLAKLHLNAVQYTGTPQWQLAQNYCDSVILSGGYSLEAEALAPFKSTNTTSMENIFTIPFDEVALQGFRLHMRTLHYNHNQTYDMPVGTWNGFGAVEDHYNTFTDDDDRKAGFIVGQQFTSANIPMVDETAESDLIIDPYIPALVMTAGIHTPAEIRLSAARVGKYEIESGAMENLNNDFPLFRYADILLMRAETSIRLGGNGDNEVNMIRERAGLDAWSGVTLDMLLEERGREMFCEGHRRQDLIRFNKFGSGWWENSGSSPDREIFPIPQWAIDANPNLN